MALDSLADQRPKDEWHDELHDQALAAVALAERGIGPEVRPLAQRVLTMLQADSAGELLPIARELVPLVAQQLRLATVGQFEQARQQVINAERNPSSENAHNSTGPMK